jgi:PAS domain S-box-containing protein
MNPGVFDDRRAADLCRAMLASTSQAVIGVNGAGSIQLVNRAAEALFGYQSGELHGQDIQVLVPESVRQIHAEELKGYCEDPQARPMGVGIELKGRRRDGSEFPVEISLNPLQIEEELMVVGLLADITERIKMEEQARLLEKMDAVGQLAGAVAHEMGNLLAAILGHTRVALNRIQGDALLASSLDALSTSAERATILTRQLFKIGGIETVQPVWFDPNHRMSEMRSQLSTIVGENIRLELVLDEDLGEILADPVQIDDVIVSLVENARDAMPNGGLLKIETAAVEAGETSANWLLPVSPGPFIMLSVTDTGLGMTPAAHAHIFEPFFTTKKAEQGAGLGLATVYSIVQNCGGSIFVSSSLNHGTTFQVMLPRIGNDG